MRTALRGCRSCLPGLALLGLRVTQGGAQRSHPKCSQGLCCLPRRASSSKNSAFGGGIKGGRVEDQAFSFNKSNFSCGNFCNEYRVAVKSEYKCHLLTGQAFAGVSFACCHCTSLRSFSLQSPFRSFVQCIY